MKIFVNYKQRADPDHEFARRVEERLRSEGHVVFRDETSLAPSEKWPARLEREVRNCDAMVSLISNAALQSNWVLNEIDLALELKKRILPVLLEEIREDLRFQALRPRFMSIQWTESLDDREQVLDSISAVLREVRLESYRDLLDAKLEAYGIADGRELLEAAFGALFQSHWPTTLLQAPLVADYQPRLNGDLAMSLAESLRNQLERWASVQSHNSSNYHQHGQDDHAKRLSWQVQRLRCFAEILDALVLAWTENASRKRRDYPPSSDEFIYIFDNSDGEQAFARPGAPMIQGGPPDKPVPPGHIASGFKVRNPAFVSPDDRGPVRQRGHLSSFNNAEGPD